MKDEATDAMIRMGIAKSSPAEIEATIMSLRAENARLTEERDALGEAVERARRHADNIGITDGGYIAQLDAALAKVKGGEHTPDDPEYSGYCELMGDEVVTDE